MNRVARVKVYIKLSKKKHLGPFYVIPAVDTWEGVLHENKHLEYTNNDWEIHGLRHKGPEGKVTAYLSEKVSGIISYRNVNQNQIQRFRIFEHFHHVKFFLDRNVARAMGNRTTEWNSQGESGPESDSFGF